MFAKTLLNILVKAQGIQKGLAQLAVENISLAFVPVDMNGVARLAKTHAAALISIVAMALTKSCQVQAVEDFILLAAVLNMVMNGAHQDANILALLPVLFTVVQERMSILRGLVVTENINHARAIVVIGLAAENVL